MIFKNLIWGFLVICAITIGVYPLTFLTADTSNGLLSLKSDELLASHIWNFSFYTHISLGGVALTIGWALFIEKIRKKKIAIHRTIGKVYIIAVLLSGMAGYYIAYHATGGIIAKFGFAGMSTAWLIPTIIAYLAIRKKDIQKHQRWMIRSYAVTFTGVTFRLWMPLFMGTFDMEFLLAYRIDSWLSWSVNLVIAEFIIRSASKRLKMAYNKV